MSAAREQFVQNDAQTVREALTWLFHAVDPPSELEEPVREMSNAALAALDRLEELAT